MANGTCRLELPESGQIGIWWRRGLLTLHGHAPTGEIATYTIAHHSGHASYQVQTRIEKNERIKGAPHTTAIESIRNHSDANLTTIRTGSGGHTRPTDMERALAIEARMLTMLGVQCHTDRGAPMSLATVPFSSEMLYHIAHGKTVNIP